MDNLTIIIPYYDQPIMLARQIDEIAKYPKGIKIIIIDDCSKLYPIKKCQEEISVYRITDDIQWNRGGARNLGSTLAKTEWIIHIDIDHILPVGCVKRLLEFEPNIYNWYRFPRYRMGKADETRRKDEIPDSCQYGKIKPHIDSYLITKEMYWSAGGYDERYSGCLGGGSPFLAQLAKTAKMKLLPDDIYLEVYTRHVIKDSNTIGLSRDTSEYQKRKKQFGDVKATNPLRFDWSRVQ